MSTVTPGVTSEQAGQGLIQGSICLELALAWRDRILHLVEYREEAIALLFLAEVVRNHIVVVFLGQQGSPLHRVHGGKNILICREGDKEGERNQPETYCEIRHHLKNYFPK